MIELDFLRSHSLFGGIPDDNLEKVRLLLNEEYFKKGEVVIAEGDKEDRLFLIFQGSVEILKKAPFSSKGIQERIAVLREGDTFGEMELIDIQPRSATVRTLEDTVAFTLSNRNLHKISKSDLPTFTFIIMNIAREISRRLRKMDNLVANFLFSSIEGTKKDEPTDPVKEKSKTPLEKG